MSNQKGLFEARNIRFQVRLTKTEYDNLKKISEYSETSMTDILRHPATIKLDEYILAWSNIEQEKIKKEKI